MCVVVIFDIKTFYTANVIFGILTYMGYVDGFLTKNTVCGNMMIVWFKGGWVVKWEVRERVVFTISD